MLRHLAPTLAVLAVAVLVWPAAPARAQVKTIVGPSLIYYFDADSVYILASKDWQSRSVRHQEKLLRHSLRLAYWRDHIPSDMRRVYDTLGYPTGRVLSQPVGHTEESWHYGQLGEPIRFRDGILVNEDRFEQLLRH